MQDFKRYHKNDDRLSKSDQGLLIEYVTHLENVIDEVKKFVGDDRLAITFQTMTQYRSEILTHLNKNLVVVLETIA